MRRRSRPPQKRRRRSAPMPKPASGPDRSHRQAPCRRGRRWRPSKTAARLIVGVDQNTFMFGYRDPSSGQLEGFDIDLAREIARRIFGDPDRVELQVVEAGQRESALASGQVDLVVRTFSITCERKTEHRLFHHVLLRQSEDPCAKGLGNSLCCRPFRQTGLFGFGDDLTEASLRPESEADPDRCHQLDRLSPDACNRDRSMRSAPTTSY